MTARHLILVGLPGSGKTTVGRRLAELLALPLVDLDEAVEEREGLSVPALFAAHGEAWFRDAESAVLLDVLRGPTGIIATGGGAVLREENRRAMAEQGFVIFLDRSPARICRTLDVATHPTVQNTTLEALSEKRRGLYLACADAVVSENDAESAAQRCAALWRDTL